jgi:hypothetical protein
MSYGIFFRETFLVVCWSSPCCEAPKEAQGRNKNKFGKKTALDFFLRAINCISSQLFLWKKFRHGFFSKGLMVYLNSAPLATKRPEM